MLQFNLCRSVIIVKIQKSSKVRQSGIELLRILLMLQVVFLHVCLYGEYSSMAKHNFSPLHKALYYLIFLSSRCPVYVYIVIFGYFSVTSNKTLRDLKSKFLKTYLPMIFYSLSIPVLGQILGLWQLGNITKVRMFFPFLSRVWYFMTLYLLVLVLSPFINKSLTAISKKQYTHLVVILFFMFSLWTSFAQLEQTHNVIRLDNIFDVYGGKSLYGFVYMYVLGGYLRLHVPCNNKAKFRYLLAFAALTFVNAVLCKFVYSYSDISSVNNNPFVVLQGLCLVLFFRDLKFKSKTVNFIASANLGVYMIHEHFLVRDKIWNDWLEVLHHKSFYSTPLYPIKILLICLTVFAVCGMIEKIRCCIFKSVETIIAKIYTSKAFYYINKKNNRQTS